MAKKSKPNNRDRYWRALGKFVDKFAAVETFIHLLLYERTRIHLETAQVVFSGTRIQVAMGYIKRMADLEPLNKATAADQIYIFEQLGHLIGLRNNLLHSLAANASYVEPGQFVASNWLRAGQSKMREDIVSSSVLLRAARDLEKIIVHLTERHLWREAGLGPINSKRDLALLAATWRYKPMQQAPNRRRNPGKNPKPARQHRASQA